MIRSHWIIALLAALLIGLPVSAQETIALPQATPELFNTQTDPVSLIGAYYNAISRGEYVRAYGYWEQAPRNQTEAQFEAGFADTQTARAIVRLPIFTDAGAGNIFASLPTLVTALRRDGTQQFYTGCFVVHKTNVPVGDAIEPDPNWYLREGTLKQQTTPNFDTLNNVCDETDTLTSGLYPPSQLEPTELIQSYFSAIATGDFVLVGSYWENPPGDLFVPSYSAVLTGAPSIDVYVNPMYFSEGAAGSIYANVPVLTVVTAADNTPYYITGCYIVRKSNVPAGNATEPDPNWHFYNATFSQAADTLSAINTLALGCSPQ